MQAIACMAVYALATPPGTAELAGLRPPQWARGRRQFASSEEGSEVIEATQLYWHAAAAQVVWAQQGRLSAEAARYRFPNGRLEVAVPKESPLPEQQALDLAEASSTRLSARRPMPLPPGAAGGPATATPTRRLGDRAVAGLGGRGAPLGAGPGEVPRPAGRPQAAPGQTPTGHRDSPGHGRRPLARPAGGWGGSLPGGKARAAPAGGGQGQERGGRGSERYARRGLPEPPGSLQRNRQAIPLELHPP